MTTGKNPARPKKPSIEGIKHTPAGMKRSDLPSTPAVETKVHQDLSLSKGEREKGPSPAYAVGKKVEEKERKRK